MVNIFNGKLLMLLPFYTGAGKVSSLSESIPESCTQAVCTAQ
jgi:hypothetical protein